MEKVEQTGFWFNGLKIIYLCKLFFFSFKKQCVHFDLTYDLINFAEINAPK